MPGSLIAGGPGFGAAGELAAEAGLDRIPGDERSEETAVGLLCGGMMLFGTWLHLSDLHIAAPGENGRVLEPGLVPLASWLPGVQGHDPRALEALEDLWLELDGPDGQARLLFTGDLTRIGLVEEHQAGEAFFDTEDVTLPSLGIPGWRASSLAGNHDHWPGSFPAWKGGGTDGLHRSFPFRFWIGAPEDLPTGHRLRFLALDTDVDLDPGLDPRRLLALGHFDRTLKKLGEVLKPPEDREVRVLLLHHSPAERRGWRLGLTQASWRQLESFLSEQRIRVMLTGHIHSPRLMPSEVDDCWEMRCGSSAQLAVPPAVWRAQHSRLAEAWRELRGAVGRPERWQPRTALVHRLHRREDGGLNWTTTVRWLEGDRFVEPEAEGLTASWEQVIPLADPLH